MIVRVILLAAAIFIVLTTLRNFRKLPASEKPKMLRKYALYAVIGIVLLMAMTGRLHWIGAAVALAVPFLSKLFSVGWRVLPLVKWLHQQKFNSSVFSTAHIRLVVDAKTGQITGELLSGAFAKQALSTLSEEQLREQFSQWQTSETESARLLNAYIQQRFGQGQQTSDSNGSNIDSRDEALEILGLEEGANDKDIVAAHRALMQKLHPDRGGSNYLAAKVNQAKDFLLK